MAAGSQADPERTGQVVLASFDVPVSEVSTVALPRRTIGPAEAVREKLLGYLSVNAGPVLRCRLLVIRRDFVSCLRSQPSPKRTLLDRARERLQGRTIPVLRRNHLALVARATRAPFFSNCCRSTFWSPMLLSMLPSLVSWYAQPRVRARCGSWRGCGTSSEGLDRTAAECNPKRQRDGQFSDRLLISPKVILRTPHANVGHVEDRRAYAGRSPRGMQRRGTHSRPCQSVRSRHRGNWHPGRCLDKLRRPVPLHRRVLESRSA